MITIEITPGELMDRAAICKVKGEKVRDPRKRSLALQQLGRLNSRLAAVVETFEGDDGRILIWDTAMVEILDLHRRLWDIEDTLRALDGKVFPCDPEEEIGEIGMDYLTAARKVYQLNDRRSELKAAVDLALGCEPEVKEYAKYERQSR